MLPLHEIDHAIPRKGIVVELGCGQGVIAQYLASTKTRQVIGVDNNKQRLSKSGQKNLIFILADIRKYDLKNVDAFVISDVLHHISFQDQKNLLEKISKSLKKGGTLVIKDVDTGEFVRSRLTRFWDFILYPKDKIYFNDANKLKIFLKSIKFEVTITRPSRLFPGSTTLFVCQKN